MTVSFAVLGGVGIKILNSAPPIPSQVAVGGAAVLFDGADDSGRTRRLAIDRRPGGRHGLGARIRTWRPIGPRTGCIASACSFSTAGRRQRAPRITPRWAWSSGRPCSARFSR